jgi:hypothetical protein
VNGDSGHDYIIQVSSNLTDWENIFTNSNPTLPFIWNDPGAGNFPHRFYRVQIAP